MDHTPTSSSSAFPNAQPFLGVVENTVHALRLVQAARQGVIPRIVRRLNDSERRKMITSGAVFVFSVEESGIKRWTDGLLWSPSRIVGNFLVYKEMHERSGGRTGQKKTYTLEEPLSRVAPRTVQWGTQQESGVQHEEPSRSSGAAAANQGLLKVNGLIKKTITVTIDGSDLHLISYYTQEDIQSRSLTRISSRPDISTLELQPHLFRFANFRNPPKIVTGRDGVQTIVCEPEEAQNLTEELPNPTSYNQERPDGIEGDRHPLSWTATSSPNRGSNMALTSDHLNQEGWQGQLDPTRMANYGGRREAHWPLEPPSGMQDSRHGDVSRYRSDNAYALTPQQEPQGWPAHSHSSPRYDLPPSPSSYVHRPVARELENNSGQTSMMVKRTDEEASLYGSRDSYIMPTRGVGDHHWNQRGANRHLPGAPTTFLAPGAPSSSNRLHLSMHPQENVDNDWSSRHNVDSASYGLQLQYPQPDSFSDTTRTFEGNLYSSGPPQSNVTGGSFKGEENEKYFGQR